VPGPRRAVRLDARCQRLRGAGDSPESRGSQLARRPGSVCRYLGLAAFGTAESAAALGQRGAGSTRRIGTGAGSRNVCDRAGRAVLATGGGQGGITTLCRPDLPAGCQGDLARYASRRGGASQCAPLSLGLGGQGAAHNQARRKRRHCALGHFARRHYWLAPHSDDAVGAGFGLGQVGRLSYAMPDLNLHAFGQGIERADAAPTSCGLQLQQESSRLLPNARCGQRIRRSRRLTHCRARLA